MGGGRENHPVDEASPPLLRKEGSLRNHLPAEAVLLLGKEESLRNDHPVHEAWPPLLAQEGSLR